MFIQSEFGFVLDSSDIAKAKFFNIDGSETAVVMVYVESRDDKRFWNACLPKLANVRFDVKFSEEHNASDGKKANGCKRLIALKELGDFKLGPNLIFCLDGDDGYLRGLALPVQEKFSQYIYYTNIYSIENAFLHGDLVDVIFESVAACTKEDVACPPSAFLSSVSAIIHSSLLLLSFCNAILGVQKVQAWKSEFYGALSSIGGYNLGHETPLADVLFGFRQRINIVSHNLLQMVYDEGLELEFSDFLEVAREKSVCPESAYLFVRGHDVYDMFVRVVDAASHDKRRIEIDRVKGVHTGSGKAIKHAVNAVHNEWGSFGFALRYAFYASSPKVPFFEDTLARLRSDYAHI